MIRLVPLVAALLNAAVVDAHALRSPRDTRGAYHVNGAQFIDERVATYSDASGQFRGGPNGFGFPSTSRAGT